MVLLPHRSFFFYIFGLFAADVFRRFEQTQTLFLPAVFYISHDVPTSSTI
jgi:hypothetical protein